MKKQLCLILVFIVSMCGCSSKGQIKPDVSGTIVGEYNELEGGSLRSVRIYGIDSEVYGYNKNTSETNYKLEPGEHTVHLVFFSKDKDPTNIFSKLYKSVFYDQTDIISINIESVQYGKYAVKSNFKNKTVEFLIVDLLTDKVIHKSGIITTTYRRKPKNPTTLINNGKSTFQSFIMNKIF